MKQILTVLIISLTISMSAAAVELEGYNINKKLINMEKSGPPDLIDNYIVFSMESNDKPAFVGAAFEFENYTKIHQYKKSQKMKTYII